MASGWPVFPCNGEKQPIVAGGFKAASKDGETINRMFGMPGAAMIGVATGSASGIVVIDIDIKNGAQGDAWLQANAHRLPTTRTHRTRSGGLHLVFLAPLDVEIRNSASRIAPGVDVRGDGGYVIIPPSPNYAEADSAPPAEMPAWLVMACQRPAPIVQAPINTTPRERIPDRYAEVAFAEELAKAAGAAENTRNDTIYFASLKIGKLVGAGLVSRSTAEAELGAIASGWPDLRKTLGTIKNGLDYGVQHPREVPEREERRQTPPARGQTEEQDQPETTEEKPKEKKRSKFVTLSIDDVLALPPPEWLIEGVLTCGGYAGIYGPPGSLKSFTVLGMGLAIAYGLPWANRPVKQMGVLYVAGEGARGLGKRIRAWQQQFNLVNVDAPFRLLCGGVNLTSPEDTSELILATLEAAEIECQPIGLVIIDTVARAMVGADENSATDMGRFNEACAEMIRGVEGAPNVFAVHHTGKDTDRGARGSNSFHGAVDTMLRVTREEDRLTLKVEKQKDDEDGFEIRLKTVGVQAPGAAPDDKPMSLVIIDASDDPTPEKVKKARLSDGAQLGLDTLLAAIERNGCERKGLQNVPGNTKSVTESEWRSVFYSRSGAPTNDAKGVAFKRAYEALSAKRVVVKEDGFCWVVRDAQ